MTSADGHCHTFDSRADGYARGEAICASTLRARTATAHCRSASSAAACGRTASPPRLTAPNGAGAAGAARGRALGRVDAARRGDAASRRTARARARATRSRRARSPPSSSPPRTRSAARARLRQGELGPRRAGGGRRRPLPPSDGAELRRRRRQTRSCARSTRTSARRSPGSRARCRRRSAPRRARAALDQPIGGVSSFGYSGTIVHTVVGMAQFARRFELEPLRGAAVRPPLVHLARGAAPARAGAEQRRGGHLPHPRRWRDCSRWSQTTSCRATSSSPARATSRWRARGVLRRRGRAKGAALGASTSCSRSCSTRRRASVVSVSVDTGGGRFEVQLSRARTSQARRPLRGRRRCVRAVVFAAAPARPAVRGSSSRAMEAQRACTLRSAPPASSTAPRSAPCRRCGRRASAGVAFGAMRKRTLRGGTQVHPADLDGALHVTAAARGGEGGRDAAALHRLARRRCWRRRGR